MEKDIKVELLYPEVKEIRALHLDDTMDDINTKLGKTSSKEEKGQAKWSFFTQDSWNTIKDKVRCINLS